MSQRQANGHAPSGPLVGVRVVDFSSFIAGPYATMLMGDLGADVIKVEAFGGDGARYWGPFFKGESRFFQGWNRNKRSLAVNLREAAGREVVHDVVRRADVVVENFRPGVTDRLGIDYETLKALNPRLIYASSTAFGNRGPYRNRPGYDPILQSLGGAAKSNERFSGKVSICSVAVSDYQASMLVVTGVTSALYHRERTGEGQKVETSLLQSIMSCQSHSYVEPLDAEEEGPLGIFPYRLFETQDDVIFIAAPTDKFWGLLCEALAVPELASAEPYSSNPKRVAHADELIEKLAPLFKQKTTAHWEKILLDNGVPCAPVQTQLQFLHEPQVEEMQMAPVIEHATMGRIRVAGVPLHMEKTPGAIQRAAPLLGEHSEQILAELGYEESRIAELVRANIVTTANKGETAPSG